MFFLKKLFVGFFVRCFAPNYEKSSFHQKILSTSIFFQTLQICYICSLHVSKIGETIQNPILQICFTVHVVQNRSNRTRHILGKFNHVIFVENS